MKKFYVTVKRNEGRIASAMRVLFLLFGIFMYVYFPFSRLLYWVALLIGMVVFASISRKMFAPTFTEEHDIFVDICIFIFDVVIILVALSVGCFFRHILSLNHNLPWLIFGIDFVFLYFDIKDWIHQSKRMQYKSWVKYRPG
ncbi:hypothetical protein IPF86_03270 [Candidatus Nomurabacteria bacterium]|jgi:hypothetical protein|nr:MAG: hypothetical protein IPF86_03270 [Candidatus Nomurabacteria bacterium]